MSRAPKEIKKSIEESRDFYSDRRKESQRKKAERKEGIKFIHDNKLEQNIFTEDFFGFEITFCYMKNSDRDGCKRYICAYAIKSLQDNYDFKTAKSILGNRLKKLENSEPDLTYLRLAHDLSHKYTKVQITNSFMFQFLASATSGFYSLYRIPQKLHCQLCIEPLYIG